MYYAYKNGKNIAGFPTEEQLHKILKGAGVTDYTVSTEAPKRELLFKRELTFEQQKKKMLDRVDAWTAKKITAGLVSNCVGYPVKYDSDRDTQDKLVLALGLVNAGVLQKEYPQGFPCRGYKQLEDGTFEAEKTIHLLTAEAVIQWNTEFGEHLKKCTAEGWAKQAEVNACTNKEELEAVVI